MHRVVAALALSLLLFAGAAAAPTAPSGSPPPARPEVTTQLPRVARPTHYDVAVTPDAQALRFRGRAAITVEVLEPTASLTLNALDLTFGDVRLSPGGAKAVPVTPQTSVDARAQTATFTFPAVLERGTYTLSLDYAGKIGTQAVGLFALDYQTAGGKQRALFTQFENSDARRMVPCWDEPFYKATFALEATVPTAHLAVSNMPVETRTDVGDGLSRVRFLVSPKMSTYLLFLAVGDLERATTRAAGTEIGVVTKRGALPQAQFALDASAVILKDFNEYFGTPYPLPKLDNIAGPGRSQFFGAMENWGAIFSFEHILLVDPTISSEADRQNIYKTAAHEISHQWFGNLVTMAWWDDLWLNESFASWMAGRTTAKLHPEWNAELDAVSDRERAMARDALVTTHPVVQHVETVEQASQAFDTITYQKGESVIRMLEGYVGADPWRDGVRRYMERHAYGNTFSDDLWQEIEKAAQKPIRAIAHDFTLQPGVPLITVAVAPCRNGATEVTLTQGEFTKDRPDKKPLAWRVPVIARAGAGTPVRTLVTGGRGTISVPGCDAVIVNAGQTGYYRTLYAEPLFSRIVAGFGTLPPVDQLGLLADSWALGRTGLQRPEAVLQLADAVPEKALPQVWGQVAKTLVAIDDYARGDLARRAAFRRFAISRLTPVLARVGWNAQVDEPAPVSILRNDLIEALGILGDPAVIAEARRRFAAGADAQAMPGALRKAILGVVARHADAATWDKLHEAARTERTTLVKDQLYFRLSSTEDEALARRALELALGDEPGATTSAGMIAEVAKEHPDLAFDFALKHMAAVNDRVDATSRSRYYPRIATLSADPGMVAKLTAYADAHVDPKSRADTENAVANIQDRVRVRNRILPALDAWVKSRPDEGATWRTK